MRTNCASATLLLGVAVLLAGCGEQIETSYGSMAEARRANAVTRGWIPPFLPASSSAIHEVHDLDTNEVWGTFRFPWSDAGFTSTLPGWSLRERVPQLVIRAPRNVSWWPEPLTGSLTASELGSWEVVAFHEPTRWLLVARREDSAGIGFFAHLPY
jgi:hypothetical protein